MIYLKEDKIKKVALVFLILNLFFLQNIFAQKYSLKFVATDIVQQQNLDQLLKSNATQTSFNDSISSRKEISKFILQLHGSGYLAASADSVANDSPLLTAFISIGDLYQWAKLSAGNVDEGILSKTGYRDKLYRNKIFQPEQVKKLEEKIIIYEENNGYPFASVSLDSIHFEKGNISAALHLEKNKLVRIDSIVIKGNADIAPVYLYNYLSIKPGDLYNEQLVSLISSRIQELPFLKETRPFRIIFTDRITRIELFTENKKASQFDGIVGLVPGNSPDQKTTFTGEAHLKLQNTLARGEVFDLNWKQLQAGTTDLKVHLLYPFLFNTPFGAEFNISIFKKDTTYIDVIENLGLQYLLAGGNYLKIFVKNTESNIISTSGLKFITALPNYADISTTLYGIGVKSEKFDYRLNPRKGYAIEADISTGNKSIHKNPEVNAVLYDSLKLSTTLYHANLVSDFYFPLMNRSVIDIGVRGGFQYSPNIFQNELFRFGGLKTLRGFDEESILATTFVIGKLEYRYLLEQNSFLFLFINGAYYQSKTQNNFVHDTPLGFGAGIDFETKLGIFSLNYALGKQFDNPIYFRSAKIHFGIVNYF